jgi:hypothetical protein
MAALLPWMRAPSQDARGVLPEAMGGEEGSQARHAAPAPRHFSPWSPGPVSVRRTCWVGHLVYIIFVIRNCVLIIKTSLGYPPVYAHVYEAQSSMLPLMYLAFFG